MSASIPNPTARPRRSDAEVEARLREQAEREHARKLDELLAASGIPERHRRRGITGERPAWSAKLAALRQKVGSGALIALIGVRGTGKTQAAVELVRAACAAGDSAKYAKAMDVFLAIRRSYQDQSTTEAEQVAAWLRPRLLVIDEYSVRGESDWEDRLLTHIIDRRYDDLTDTVLISNQSGADFGASVGPSIYRRLCETGGVVECNWEPFV